MNKRGRSDFLLGLVI